MQHYSLAVEDAPPPPPPTTKATLGFPNQAVLRAHVALPDISWTSHAALGIRFQRSTWEILLGRYSTRIKDSLSIESTVRTPVLDIFVFLIWILILHHSASMSTCDFVVFIVSVQFRT